MSIRKKKIKYGEVDIPDSEFDSRNVKARITTFIDLDVLDHLRLEAKKQGIGYQTLINQALRAYIEKPSIEKRLEIIEKKLDKRLT